MAKKAPDSVLQNQPYGYLRMGGHNRAQRTTKALNLVLHHKLRVRLVGLADSVAGTHPNTNVGVLLVHNDGGTQAMVPMIPDIGHVTATDP